VSEAETIERLRERGIRPTAQRVVVADYVLHAVDHPSAEHVLAAVEGKLPILSRATVYNTLGLLVERGLLQALVLEEGHVVYDPCLEPHHHFVDEETGHIEDVPRGSLEVIGIERLEGYAVREHSIVLRGRKRPSPA
jgi:Fur family transcriptional regulator, iron response regulator